MTITNYIYLSEPKNQVCSTKTVELLQKKLFLIYQKFTGNSITQDSFGLKMLDYMTKIRGFSDFFEMLSTMRSRNFFSTEPIFNFFDFLKRYRSESLISAILDAQIKIRVPPSAHLCSSFCKNVIHSPIQVDCLFGWP